MNLNSQTKNQTNLLYNIKFWVITIILVLIYSSIIFAQNTVYIDPTNSGDPGQDGSIDHPYDSWGDVSPQSNTSYLQKRGTMEVRTSTLMTLSSSSLHDIYIGAYGDGERPQIHFDDANGIYLKYTRGITIENLELIGNYGVTSDAYHNDAVFLSGHTSGTVNTTQTTVRNCKIHRWGAGITSLVFPGGSIVDTLMVDNVEIFDIADDGIFGGIDNLTVQNSHIYRVNRHWYTIGHSQLQSGGDCIHFRGNNYLIQNNILDRSNTGNKFCLIYGSNTYHPDRGRILWNTFYPPQDTTDDDGGACIYVSQSAYVEIAYNKFIGRGYTGPGQQPGGGTHLESDTVNFYYNLADSVSGFGCTMNDFLPDKELNFLNNTFIHQYDQSVPVIISFDTTTAKNNIFAIEDGVVPFSSYGDFYADTANNIIVNGNSSNWGTNPGFVNWQNQNYRIGEDSPATNSGSEYIGCYCDMDSVEVPQQGVRDIGVFEYTDGGPNTNTQPSIESQDFNLTENTANGQTVGTVVASDPDPGQTLSFSIISGNTDNAFQIGVTTGSLTVANVDALNFETNPSFALVVQVQDNGPGGLTNQATITINLTDANEIPQIANQDFSVEENSNNGTQVGTVVASDPDNGQSLTFSIVSGNTDNAFQINATSGILTVATSTALNFEDNPTFNLVVQAQDDGAGNLSNQATITVNLTDLNEVPQIENQNFAISENSNNGTQVGTVVASDPDNGQSLTFSIVSGNTDNAFQINPTSGILTVATSSALDFEDNPTFNLVIQAQDDGAGNLSSQATITVNLTDINEVPQIENQSFSINENSNNGTQIGTVVATDPDDGQALAFAIISGNIDNAFQINPISGILTVATSSALDFEDNPTFNLVIQAQDDGSGNLSSQATIIVNLTDINEVPQIENQNFAISENSNNGTQVGTVVATDPDNGQTLAFTIISGNTGNAFQVNSGSGVLTVANSAAVNFEVNPTFTLEVRAQDNGTGNLYSLANVIINLADENEVPEIVNQSFSLSENSANGIEVGTVDASDPDNGQILTFSIISGNSGSAFQINSTSGLVSVANTVALNFEDNPSFALTVRAQDNGPGSLFTEATITVNLIDINEIPLISSQSFAINENAFNGAQAGVVVASDPDNGQSVTYSITSGNTGAAFGINSSSGLLTVANSTMIDFESNPVFVLVVTVVDNGTGSLSNQADITVNLNDLNETPEIENQNFSIDENSSYGVLVGMLSASDPDNGQTLTFSILSGNVNNAFQLNSTTGNLSVLNSSALDFESNPTYSLVVNVQDNGQGNLSVQATIYIDVDDVNESPEINNQGFVIEETIGNGELVGYIEASDPDNGQTLSYSILDGNLDGAFYLNSATGALLVADNSVFDFTTYPVYYLDVQVQDNGTGDLTGQAVITVSLTDINQVPNIESQSFSIAENSYNGQVVGAVVASDPDVGQTLTYSIISGNTGDAFIINTENGELSVNNSSILNFESIPEFYLMVRVQDNGPGSLSDMAAITVSLIDINEVPVINDETFAIDENSDSGQQVGIVTASDPDNGQTLSFSILSGNLNGAFEIGLNTGILTVSNSSALNFESVSVFSLVVEVEDDGTGDLSDQATIIVNIDDVNEMPEIFDLTLSIDENSTNGQEVGVIAASDPDVGQNITYSIVSGNTNDAFAIGLNSGILSVSNSSILNFESSPVFSLVIEAQDDGSGNLTDQATITINLIDVNEIPEIEDLTFNIVENSANGQQVGVVYASDPDLGQSITFNIVSGNENNAFAIGMNSGVLTVSNSSALNFESTPAFSLVVEAEDDGTGNLSDQATITVNLDDVNEMPEIENQTLSIEENSAIGQEVGVIVASDPDVGQNLTFSIVSGNIDNTFEIETLSGTITIANSDAINFETNPSFVLVVEAQDDGQGNLTNQASITVDLLDVNEIPNIENQEFEIVENSLSGDQVGFVLAADPDNGQMLYFSIISGNTNDAFQIGETSGILTVANSSELNFEETTEFSLSIQVQDDGQGNLSDIATVVVNLLDVNEAPEIETQAFEIDENTIAGEDVGIVVAVDPDQGQSLTYSILSGNSGDAFEIIPTTGAIIVANSSALNFELIPSFNLMIQVVDDGQGNMVEEAIVTIDLIDVNENPVIENHVFDVDEFSPAGYEVGLIDATDPDFGQSLTYSILSGNIEDAFQIDSETGMLTVNNSDALNYDINPVFNLIVEVYDDGLGNLSDQASVIITLIDMTSTELLSASGDFSYNLYPNPAKESVNLSLDNLESGELTIIISKINGEVMLKKEFQVFDGEFKIGFDVYDLQRGLYLINIINGKVAVMDKFIKL